MGPQRGPWRRKGRHPLFAITGPEAPIDCFSRALPEDARPSLMISVFPSQTDGTRCPAYLELLGTQDEDLPDFTPFQSNLGSIARAVVRDRFGVHNDARSPAEIGKPR